MLQVLLLVVSSALFTLEYLLRLKVPCFEILCGKCPDDETIGKGCIQKTQKWSDPSPDLTQVGAACTGLPCLCFLLKLGTVNLCILKVVDAKLIQLDYNNNCTSLVWKTLMKFRIFIKGDSSGALD